MKPIIIIIVLAMLPGLFLFTAVAGEPDMRPAARKMGEIRVVLGQAVEFATRFKVVSMAVGMKEIAEVMPVTPTRIRILGLKPGTTNLIIRFAGKAAQEYEIFVNQGYTVEVLNGTVTNPDASLRGW